METASKQTLMTDELAERAGVNLQTVRYYERRELIPEPPRTAAGYRQYSVDDVRRIRFIQRAQELGFTLSEIKELLALRAHPQAPTQGAVKQKTEEKIAEIEGKIRDLARMKLTLVELAAACDGEGIVSECPILEALEAPLQ